MYLKSWYKDFIGKTYATENIENVPKQNVTSMLSGHV